jgi:hypothetical protein
MEPVEASMEEDGDIAGTGMSPLLMGSCCGGTVIGHRGGVVFEEFQERIRVGGEQCVPAETAGTHSDFP